MLVLNSLDDYRAQFGLRHLVVAESGSAEHLFGENFPGTMAFLAGTMTPPGFIHISRFG